MPGITLLRAEAHRAIFPTPFGPPCNNHQRHRQQTCERDALLEAGQENGFHLCEVVEHHWRDHEIVLAAVRRTGLALRAAAEEVQRDRDIVLAAVEDDPHAFLDGTFAPEVKEAVYILKIAMLSGRSTVLVSKGHDFLDSMVERCCRRLGMNVSGTETLLCGTEAVLDGAEVRDWPGGCGREGR
eukprot:2925763-Amphidinium_carterae.1